MSVGTGPAERLSLLPSDRPEEHLAEGSLVVATRSDRQIGN